MRFERWLKTVRLRMRTLFRRSRVERELDDEIAFHLARQIEQNIERGMSPYEARYAAMRSMGGIEQHKEAARDMRRVNVIDHLVQDLRYAGRILRRSPGFSAVAVVSLAIGIGANTAVFSVIHPLFLERLPVPDPERLVSIGVIRPDLRIFNPGLPEIFFAKQSQGAGISYREFERFRDSNRLFSGVFVVQETDNRLITGSEEAGAQGEDVKVERVSGEFFPTLGVGAVLGRTLVADDDRAGAPPVAMISHGFWQRRFGRDPNVIGKAITLTAAGDDVHHDTSRTLLTIVGVVAPGFSGLQVGETHDLWIPLQGKPRGASPRDYNWWDRTLTVARLLPGFSFEEAEAAAGVVYKRTLDEWAAEFGGSWTQEQRDAFVGQQIVLRSQATGESRLRNQFGQGLVILMVAVGSVLLIACANLGALLLARAAARQKELAVRLAIGSGRMRLVRQLLTESVLVAAIGGAAGLVVAYAGVQLLLGYAPDLGALHIALSVPVLLFTLTASVLSAAVFGLLPALRSTKLDLNPTLKDGHGNWGRTRSRLLLNKLVVVSQIAIAMVLLVGAGLLVRTLYNLRSVNTGFDKDGVVVVSLQPFLEPDRFMQLLSRIEALPGVQSATGWDTGLLGRGISQSGPILVDGFVPEPGVDLYAFTTDVPPRFFETIGVSLVAGRDIGLEDASRRVAVISEAMARFFFASENPIGRRFRTGPNAEYEIIGVAEDAKYASVKEEPRRAFYAPFTADSRIGNLAIRSSSDIDLLSSLIRVAVQETDRQVQVTSIQTMGELTDSKITQERFVAQLAGFFSLLALFLACVGLYGTLSHAVAQRTKEIGVRMALGARIPNVIGMLMRETAWTVGIGAAIGGAVALAVTRMISSLLFGLTPTDPATLAVAALLLFLASAAAAYVPSRRASRVDPMVALRHD